MRLSSTTTGFFKRSASTSTTTRWRTRRSTRRQLAALYDQIKSMAKAGDAVLASDLFTFNNSLAQGRQMTRELSKLMLRAYNAEADNCVRTLRAGNVLTAKKRLDASVTRDRQARRDDGDADQP